VASANWTTGVLATYLAEHTGIAVSDETVPPVPACPRLCLQAPDLDPPAAGERAGRLPGKRLRVEALLAGALDPTPPPLAELVEPDLLPELPADTASLLALLPQADLYLQDEVHCALHPTLTRVWSRKGRRGQRLIEAPGRNEKTYGFGVVDWRDGWFAGQLAPGRTATAFCDQVRAVVVRSRARGRVAIVVCDNLRTHPAAGSTRVRQLLTDLEGTLHVVYTPAYDPDANRIEWLWRVARRVVTHNHQRRDFATLCADAEAHVHELAAHPEAVLAHIGSPGCPVQVDSITQPLAHAA
jgi:transposase